ncbi:helix-turn-helix domain-containing protein [Streptomyces sp. S07_1.15]|uniref:helix-turn-helix transcriptional regulator n=1 Tax=Streptomyces sp. S07_1.15 TaxID=2873925 RepID=UPI001D1507F6|nr:helix-turn-helix domain-containing protein [Streptomyces sp. S07_1.15]MCC3649917.1 helix-turn-helix domain-containing protein [Streptomyces sp. S07_1.15]
MPRHQLTDPGTGTPAPAQRGRRAAVLRCLRSSGEPLGAAEVAERLGVHLNTARFHLDALVAEELAVRGTAPRTEPGRPKIVYSAADAGDDGSRSFRLLADILVGAVSSTAGDPAAAATDAGRAWGGYLTEAPAPTEAVGAGEGQRRLVENLESMGFVTEAAEEDGEPRIRLHHCPFLEVARRRQDIVCGIHLGLMQGTLETLRAPLAVESLEPFAAANLCVARLRHTGPPPGAGR